MILEIAIGDAYGAGFEFCAREKITQFNTLNNYITHELGIEAGHYTDDTQMSIAISEVILSVSNPVSSDFATAFVQCYKRDPRKGYAQGFQRLLDECENGEDLQRKIHPKSKRNGAAMRSVPLGLISNKNQLLRMANEQAVVTHNSSEGIISSQIIALMAHYLLYERCSVIDLPMLIKRELGFSLMSDWNKEIECDAIQTVHAVNTAIIRNRSMSSLLLDCINFGGDVDSVAAISMGLASLTAEYTNDIPDVLINNLENSNYGRNYLIHLDTELSNCFPILCR